jgi:hypothetical protein
MKKIILLSVFIATISAAYSQYFTVKIGGGYSVPGVQNSGSVLTFQPTTSPDPANAAIIPLLNYNTAAIDSGNRYKSNLYAGYAQGGHIDFSFGYMINPYFGVQLDGAYLWGTTITASQTYDDDPINGVLGKTANIITKTHANGLSINPSLYFRAAKPTAKVAPYARAGIALPIAGAIYHDLNISAPNSILGNITSSDIGVKTTSTVSIGFQGSVGVSFTPVPLISIWAELQGQYLLIKAKEAQLTSYLLSIQGFPQQNFLTTSNIHGAPYSTYSQVTNFVDVLTPNSNTQAFGKGRVGQTGYQSYVNENAPQDQLRQVANIGAFGFAVGITFNMSKKIFKDPFGKKAKAEAK